MGYQCETRVFSGKWIMAPEDYLKTLVHFPELQMEPGKWIWPHDYARGFFRRDFQLHQEVSGAWLELWCDNTMDVYVNGEKVAMDTNYTGVLEIGSFLRKGFNWIAVRAYQSNSPLWLVSAMRGNISVRLENGEKYQYPTDDNWRCWNLHAYYESREPVGWLEGEEEKTSMVTFQSQWVNQPLCTTLHSRVLRRSCYLKKRFTAGKPIVSATLYATARGIFEAYLNGKRTDTAVLSPGVKDKYLEYLSIDVTNLLQPGDNMLAIILANGWYNCIGWGSLFAKRPQLLAELELTYEDGTKEFLVTDEDWLLTASPWTEDDIQYGEKYDARMEIPDWNTCNGKDDGWVNAEACPISAKDLPLVLQNYPPIRRTKRSNWIHSQRIKGDTILYDFGEGAAGRCSIVLRNSKPGEVVKIQYCEKLDENGMPWPGPYTDTIFPYDSISGGKASWCRRNVDVYICKGDEEEVYEPRFTYTGFRYIYVESDQAEVVRLEKLALHNDLDVTGEIDAEYPLINQLWEAITRSYRSNIVSGPTDCPSREKNYWNGDIQIFAHTACWYMDNSGFLGRWTHGGRKLEYGTYGWEDEEYILPLVLYRFYGDKEIIRVKYPVVCDLLRKRREDMGEQFLTNMRAFYRDHQAIENKMAPEFYARCYYCLQLKSMAEMADILGYFDESAQWTQQFEEAKAEFLNKYYQCDNGDFGQDCQGGQILPLAFGLVPEEEREKAVERLLYYIEKAEYHLTTGFMSTEHLLNILCDHGRDDVAWRIFRQKDFPSWQYMMDTGTTTVTETWYGNTMKDRWGSSNHFALGNVGRWFFEYLGGIRVDQCAPGFAELVVKPVFIPEVGRFRMKFRSVRGEIISAWEVTENEIRWALKIPEGVKATVYLPDGMQQLAAPYEFAFQISRMDA